ncbi:MAG: hypothetical protein HQL01_12915 [Nitrospirae bacterium]|nr:hypothetical protein [Nitrospirota bacterium]
MPQTQTIKQFTGLKNTVAPDRLAIGELQEAVNVDIDNTGQCMRRGGYTLIQGYSGAAHSLFMQDGLYLYRSGTELRRFVPDAGYSVLRNDMGIGLRTWYVMVNGITYYSDGISTGAISNGVNRTWGLAIPANLGILTATTGNLKAGAYTVCQTYLRNDGQESGTSAMYQITVDDNSGIVIPYAASADSSVQKVNIYMTAKNGAVFFRAAQVDNADGSFTYTGDTKEFYIGLSDSIKQSGPPIPASILEQWNGRIYGAFNNILWYTRPFSYELLSLDSNYIAFNSKITLLAATGSGIFVGTAENIYYLQGNPQELMLVRLADYGVVYGTQAKVDASCIGDGSMSGICVFFVSSKGVCAGFDGGQVRNLTHETYSFGSANEGYGAFVQRNGINQYVFGIQDPIATGMNRYERAAYSDVGLSELGMPFVEFNNQLPILKGVN